MSDFTVYTPKQIASLKAQVEKANAALAAIYATLDGEAPVRKARKPRAQSAKAETAQVKRKPGRPPKAATPVVDPEV